jgi:hypothetical protein
LLVSIGGKSTTNGAGAGALSGDVNDQLSYERKKQNQSLRIDAC